MITKQSLKVNDLYKKSPYFKHFTGHQDSGSRSNRSSTIQYGDNTINYGRDCCDFIAGTDNDIKVLLPLDKVPFAHIDEEYVKRWMEFINSLGFPVDYQGIQSKSVFGKQIESYVFDLNINRTTKYPDRAKGRDSLLAHSFVRYLWSLEYSGVIDNILEFRDSPDFKDLDNWQIAQLVHILMNTWDYHGLYPNAVYSILPETSIMSRRMIDQKNIHATYTFGNIRDVEIPAIADITHEKALEIFNILKVKKNKHVGLLVSLLDSKHRAKYNLKSQTSYTVEDHVGKIYILKDSIGDLVRIRSNKFELVK